MSRIMNFADDETVAALSKKLISELRPRVTAQVVARNKVRDAHTALVARIATLKARQAWLTDMIWNLREEGVSRIQEDKANQAVSIKINAHEAEMKENQGWLARLEPEAEALANDLVTENKALLELMRLHLQPLQAQAAEDMNLHLLAASKIRHSFPEAVAKAIAEAGDDPNLGAGIPGTLAFRLKVDSKNSTFVPRNR